jgi:hypothetical protein
MNSPQNENGKTNLPLSLCQETGSHLTVERGSIRTGSRTLAAADLLAFADV